MRLSEINAIALLSSHVEAQTSCVKAFGPKGKLCPKVIGFEYPTAKLDSFSRRLGNELIKAEK